jgi:hypothetical protein
MGDCEFPEIYLETDAAYTCDAHYVRRGRWFCGGALEPGERARR